MEVRHDDPALDYVEPVEFDEISEKTQKALKDPRVTSVRIHKPGSAFTASDGVKNFVNDDGTIRPVFDKAERKKKQKAQRKARKKNR